jgi:hypothetical protein
VLCRVFKITVGQEQYGAGERIHGRLKLHLQAVQKGRPARPQRAKTRGVPSGAHGATNKEHQVCARRRVVRRPGPR